MKQQKVPEVNLPYASTVASFFGDQGVAQGNSFLGRLFKGGGRTTKSQSQSPLISKAVATPPVIMGNKDASK